MKNPILIEASDIEIIWQTAERIGRQRSITISTINGIIVGVLAVLAAESVIVLAVAMLP